MRIIWILFLLPQFVSSQEHHLAFFEKLMDCEWKAEGTWGDGSSFKQSVHFEYALDSHIVIAHSNGFIDQAHQKYGTRNHGIRKYDPISQQVKFWEFDIFGGTTEGTVLSKDNNIIYQYKYGEKSIVTDMWEYLNDSTYNFKVGDYRERKWHQTYLVTQFKAVKISKKAQLYSQLKNKIVGHWFSKAWDGLLSEYWSIDEHGHIIQRAEYIENDSILYQASNKIELVDDELILFSVIKDSNPKIFKAISFSEKEIIFENADYKNPNKVIYTFAKKDEFQRSISGIENEKPSNYIFEFKRIE